MTMLAMGALAPAGVGANGQASEGHRDTALLLNGAWELARGSGDERAETAAGQAKLTWRKVTVPGPLFKWDPKLATSIRFVWLRRTFTLTADQARSLAVLRWNRIALGATAFINGVKVGQNEPTGPYQVIVGKGVLRPGENQIVLKVCGAKGVRTAKSGYFLIPAGFASCHKRGVPAVTDDVWLDFADGVYLKWVLAMPDLARSRVRLRVTPVGCAPGTELGFKASVRPWPKGKVVWTGETTGKVSAAATPTDADHFFVDVPMPDFKAWTPEERNLYVAEVTALRSGKLCDAVSVRFGMREIGVAGGNYKLNGKNVWLRGSNLVFEWDWGDVIKGKEEAYLVTEAREMSMNSFRTHTQPPPRLWADICDEHGTMILAEFPVLYNYRDYKFTPDEYKIWHRNCLIDAAGWMARLWNHPAVVMWVLSNESRNDNRWERTVLQKFVNGLDPTRPTLRTGTDGTKDNYDVHTCGNITRQLNEGTLQQHIAGWFRTGKGRTVTNTEYMNRFKSSIHQWTGTDSKPANARAVAQIGAEHTEAMRRTRLDGIWPYMYAGWTKTRTGREWKAGFASPLSAAWHSTLSPILASLDLFDPNYVAGQEVTTDLHLINETWHEAKVHVDLLLTTACPEGVPEAECFKRPVAKWSFDFTLAADSVRVAPVKWTLPAEQGGYWLTARTTGAKKRPVLSQRFVRAIKPAEPPRRVKERTFVVLGGDKASAKWFKAKRLTTTKSLAGLDPKTQAVIIWNSDRVTPGAKRAASKPLCEFAAAGGRVTVLGQHRWHKWSWKGLCDVGLGAVSGSRVFVHKGPKHAALRGIDPAWLVRWNGLPGTVAVGNITGPAMKKATNILWVRDPDTPVMAEVPAAAGKGAVLFSRLAIQHRLDPARPGYDPVAERVLLNILGR